MIDEVIKTLKFDKTSEDTIYNEQFYEQLIQWLEELKAKRNIGECAYKQGYNKGIDEYKTDIINKIDFEEKWIFNCKSNNADTNIAFSALKTFAENIAEHLKEGVNNEIN